VSCYDRAAWRGWVPISLAALGAAATIAGLENQFVQDDLSLIVRNEAVHTLTAPASFFTRAYWQDPFPPALYRPLATAVHALQWAAGNGSPVPFRITSMVMLITAGLAFFQVASRLLPRSGAWAAAAVFMVHPVHVEATSPAVNQGELMVGLLVCVALTLYLRARERGAPGTLTIAAILAIYLAAALFKEHALILPALLIGAELTVIRSRLPAHPGIAAIRPLVLYMGLVAAGLLAIRTAVVGSSVGTPAAEALWGAAMPGRALTMLGVVPEWARLLFWPWHLQADYGPNEIIAATGWGLPQLLGALLLTAFVGFLIWGRARHPTLAFGMLWTAVALLPVSNVVVPTGVVLAERTLFLASMGAALSIGASFALLREKAATRRQLAWAVSGVLAILLALGLTRSVTRTRVWRTQGALLQQTVIDAPRSYTTRLALTRFLEDSGSAVAARAHYREAVALMPAVQQRERFRAEQYRLAGNCRSALRHYRRALLITPADSSLQAGLAACLAEEDTSATKAGRTGDSRPFGAVPLSRP
jgi:protein O-mannosyl-transferase